MTGPYVGFTIAQVLALGIVPDGLTPEELTAQLVDVRAKFTPEELGAFFWGISPLPDKPDALDNPKVTTVTPAFQAIPTGRTFPECGKPLPEGARSDSAYCSGRCRQKAYRKRNASLRVGTSENV